MKKVLCTNNAPGAIGPYSQGIKAGNTIYVSGQLPIDPAKGEFAGSDIKSQTRQSLSNIKAILGSEGVSMNSIVKTTVFLQNMDDFTEMNQVYSEFFTSDYPARAAVEVAKLPKGALVEIEAIAYIE